MAILNFPMTENRTPRFNNLSFAFLINLAMHWRRDGRFPTSHARMAFPRHEGACWPWWTELGVGKQNGTHWNRVEQEVVESCCLEVLWSWCYSRPIGFTSRAVPNSCSLDQPWTLVRIWSNFEWGWWWSCLFLKHCTILGKLRRWRRSSHYHEGMGKVLGVGRRRLGRSLWRDSRLEGKHPQVERSLKLLMNQQFHNRRKRMFDFTEIQQFYCHLDVSFSLCIEILSNKDFSWNNQTHLPLLFLYIFHLFINESFFII